MNRIFRTIYVSIALVLVIAPSAFAATPASILSTQIATLVKKFPSTQFNGEIVDSGGIALYSKTPTALSQPASNMKLFTTSAALAALGKDFTFETSVYGAKPVDGIVTGDIVLYGRGDPTLMDTDLDDMAQQFVDAGIMRINGDLIADESYLTGSAIPPGRNAVDIASYYGAEVSALTIYENLVGITLAPGAKVGAKPIVRAIVPTTAPIVIINNATTGSTKARSTFNIKRGTANNTFVISGTVPLKFYTDTYYLSIHDPAAVAGAMFAKSLKAHGIILAGTVRATASPAPTSGLRELASVESDTLDKIVVETNKRSNNLFAELLLRQLGHHVRTTALSATAQTDETLGIAAIKTYLRSFGIDTSMMTIVDGSGLGKGQAVSPQSMSILLRALPDTDYGSIIFDSLPVAGIDGTLKNRFANTAAAGTLRAKTGTLDTVDSLSGTIPTASGNGLFFSFFTTHAAKAAGGKVLIDGIAKLLASYAIAN